MCTRALYVGADDLVITGRSMDWGEDMHSNAWVFPRGIAREGAAGPTSPRWTSTYGSLVISSYEAGTADGMNEAGLVMNGLYLAESDYGPSDERPPMSIMAFGQYVLDTFGSVADAVAGLGNDAIRMVAPVLPNGRVTTMHMSLSDPSGDSAIFEYIAGKLVIHHGKAYTVMTNSPTFDQQLAIETYWRGVDPLTFLPGSINAADRFARVSFFINAIPKELDPHTITAVPGGSYGNQAVASVMSVMRSISAPLGITHPTKPNISSTLWRTAWDHKNKVMFFDSATSPNAFWVPMADLDFSEGAPVKKLTIAGGTSSPGTPPASSSQRSRLPSCQRTRTKRVGPMSRTGTTLRIRAAIPQRVANWYTPCSARSSRDPFSAERRVRFVCPSVRGGRWRRGVCGISCPGRWSRRGSRRG